MSKDKSWNKNEEQRRRRIDRRKREIKQRRHHGMNHHTLAFIQQEVEQRERSQGLS